MKNLFPLVPFFLLLSSCTLKEQIRTLCDDQIDSKIQRQIDGNIEQLIQSIKTNDCQNFTMNASDAFKMVLGEQYCTEFEWIYERLKGAEFKILSKVYAKKSLDMSVARFSVEIENDEFDFAFNQAKKESHVTFIEAALDSKSFFITLVYSKIGDKWLLDVFNIGEYKLHGKTAIDYYELSKNLIDKGLLIESYIQFELAQKLINPSEGHIRYRKQAELEQFKVDLDDKVRDLQFPIEISDINTNPSLHSISLVQTDEGLLPVFLYQTSINLNDTIQLKLENNQLHDFIKSAYPSIFKTGFSKALYRTANEIKEDNSNNPSYGFTVFLE